MKKVIIYTDGACSYNPGPGGWGAILQYNDTEKEISGGEKNTTNNRMELTAAIEALSALKTPCEVELYSDSKYLIDAIEKGWIYSWKKKNFMISEGKQRVNTDLWLRLLEKLSYHKVKFFWVKGHNDNPKNERCDQLAVKKVKEFL